jgi:hypothetical protein
VDNSWAWWYKPIIPALKRLRQQDCGFQVSLGYIVRPCLKKERKKERKKKGRGRLKEYNRGGKFIQDIL